MAKASKKAPVKGTKKPIVKTSVSADTLLDMMISAPPKKKEKGSKSPSL